MGAVIPNVNHNTNYAALNFAARGGGIEVGAWTPTTLGGYTTVGEVITFASGKTPKMVIFQPLIALTAPTTLGYGVDYRYDATNCSVRAFLASTLSYMGGGAEASTTYASATTAGIPYIAFSW
jgi:hypothetical protein